MACVTVIFFKKSFCCVSFALFLMADDCRFCHKPFGAIENIFSTQTCRFCHKSFRLFETFLKSFFARNRSVEETRRHLCTISYKKQSEAFPWAFLSHFVSILQFYFLHQSSQSQRLHHFHVAQSCWQWRKGNFLSFVFLLKCIQVEDGKSIIICCLL